MKAVEILGKEHVPETGVLLVPSSLRLADLHLLEKLINQRPVAFLISQGADHDQGFHDYLGRESVRTIYYSETNPNVEKTAGAVAQVAAENGVVVFVPAPASVRVASLTTVPSGTLQFLLDLGTPTVPVFVDHPRDLRLSIEPPRANPETVFSFGRPLEGEALSVAGYLEELLVCGERAFSKRPLLEGNLAHAIVTGLSKHGGKATLVDGLDGSELRYDKLLAAAIALSKHLAQETNHERIGIILPPGKAAFVANVAALIAGKTPVNLNFTAGQKSVESAIKQSGIDRFVTADPFVRKMQKFPWPPNRQLIFLERILPHMKPAIAKWLVISKLLPAGALCKLLKIPAKGGHREATLMFTSGSSGEPKGAVMSHRNLLGNVAQFSFRLGLRLDERILACLPLFHCFGCTVTMWYPLIEGISTVTYPTPAEVTKLAELIEKHGVGLLVSTPTFYRGYLRKVKREQLAPVRYVVSGAEKLPAPLRDAFQERFGKEMLEGYGLTETAPVTNVNLPDPERPTDSPATTVLPSNRPGSTGQLMPGLALRIVEPETGARLPIDQSGLICFKGANVFEGYLNNPARTEEVLQDGWFRTGDIGRLDSEGFLYIEGRLSRFSKIAGEMVPHEVVEAYCLKALRLEQEDERKVAVVGIPDEARGEILVLLSTVAGETNAQELIDLRYTMLDLGVPSLWIPRKLIPIGDVPVLASGKLDLKTCEEIARKA
ncbi:hypothetical protein BH23VER1_BH23VER1_08020 [soil metagenome]